MRSSDGSKVAKAVGYTCAKDSCGMLFPLGVSKQQYNRHLREAPSEGRPPQFGQCSFPRPPHDAHRRRVGRRAPTPTITTDRRLARPCGEQKFGSLRACRMLCDVWTLARNARKLAFHSWARGRTAVVGSLCDAPIGSSTSSPATSQHGSSLDGSLLSMLLAFCTASPGSL